MNVSVKARLLFVTILCIVALNFAVERPAYGYVDPGSGLFLLQNISAMATGVLFFFRRRIKAFFVKSPKTADITTTATDTVK